MSENLPEIYITINKWRKSNFTLSFAPIFFFFHVVQVAWYLNSKNIDVFFVWIVQCVLRLGLHKPKHKNTSICIVQHVSIFGIACVCFLLCVCSRFNPFDFFPVVVAKLFTRWISLPKSEHRFMHDTGIKIVGMNTERKRSSNTNVITVFFRLLQFTFFWVEIENG